MDPIVTPSSIDFSLPVVAGAVIVGLAAAVAFTLLRRFTMASGDELKELASDIGPRIARTLLRRRAMPTTPWFCSGCRSENGPASVRCYRCAAPRLTSEAPVPDAPQPAGPGAGRSTRRG
jgi:hypothetical protein